MSALDDLFDAARSARDMAYAPYSKFPVGAAILAVTGRIYAGCNVENAAFPSGTCAEAGAIAAMIVAGERRINQLLVLGNGPLITPCGSCRQRIHEFSDEQTQIHCAGPDGVQKTFLMSDLLPYAFGPRDVLRAVAQPEV